MGDYSRAADMLHEFINSVEDIAAAHQDLAIGYASWGKLDLALSEIDRAFTLNPNNKNYVVLKGEILYYKNDLPAAEKELRPLLDAAEPEIKRTAILYLSYIQVTRGQFRKAIEQLEQRIALAEKTGEKIWAVQTKFSLSYIFGSLAKDYRKFLELNNEILKFASENKNIAWSQNALFTRAWGLAAMGSFPEALKAAEEVKKLYEGNLNKKLIRNYYAVMGKIELERNDFAKAIKYCEDALALFSLGDLAKPAYIYDFLGQAYYRSGDLEKARLTYEKIPTLTTGRLAGGDVYARSFYWLGKIYERLGNKLKALENYGKFLDLWKDADPGLPEVEDSKKSLAALKG
jgi:tetratricopeptide (TPR) repeat protein